MSAFLGPIHIYAEQAKKLAEKAKIRDDVNKFNLIIIQLSLFFYKLS